MDLPEHVQALALLFGAILVGLVTAALIPTVSLGGVTVQTSLALGVAGSLLVFAVGAREYREGETRAGFALGLYGVGFLLSLVDYVPVAALGIVVLLLSLGAGMGLDHRVRERLDE